MKNNNCKKLGIFFAGIGVPLLIIGIVATAFSPTDLSVLCALVGIAFSGLAFIIISGMLS